MRQIATLSLLLGCGSAVHAVIVYGTPGAPGDTGRLTTPNADILPAWNLTGQFTNGRTFVPIGGNLVLFAKHVFFAVGQVPQQQTNSYPVYLNGQTYWLDTTFGDGTGVVLDPGGDFGVMRINGTFSASASLYSGTDDATGSKQAVVIGAGTQRGDPVMVSGLLKGWKWGAGATSKSWGLNNVNGPAIDPNYSAVNGNTPSLAAFRFDSSTPEEATVSAGDSSGGVFIKQGSTWMLAGLVSYIYPDQYRLAGSSEIYYPASVFDSAGLETPYGTFTGGQYWYATRVSQRTSFLDTVIPYTASNYTVSGTVDRGDVAITNLLRINNNGTLQASKVTAGTLQIDANAQVVIEKSGTPNGTSRINALTIHTTGKFDVKNNALIVQSDGTNFTTLANQINAYVASGRIGAGYGITSSTVTSNKTLAVIPNRTSSGAALLSTFGGQSVDANSILVKLSRVGDLNLDGWVNIDDYFQIDVGYASGASTYWQGDLNYSGSINADDYMLMDSQFLIGGQLSVDEPTPVGSIDGIGGANTVPEPGIAGLLLLGGMCLLRRKRATPAN